MNRDERKRIAKLLVQHLWVAGFLDAEILGGGTKVKTGEGDDRIMIGVDGQDRLGAESDVDVGPTLIGPYVCGNRGARGEIVSGLVHECS